MKKVCLINPPRLILKYSRVTRPSPPLGLAYIAGTLKALDCEVSVIDSLAEAPNHLTEYDGDIVMHGLSYKEIADRVPENVDMIGITCMFTNNWMCNRELIDYLGVVFPNALILSGGEHTTAAPEFSMRQATHLDICVLGEGEETITEVVKTLRTGGDMADIAGIVYRDESRQIQRTPPRSRIQDIVDIPWPAWEVFPVEQYQEHKFSYGVSHGRSLPVMATRGCPYRCTFCSSPDMWGTRYMMRPTEDILSEIQYLYKTYNITNFDFLDLTAIIKREWIKEFAAKIIASEMEITWQIPAGTRMEAIDEEISQYLYDSGCVNITYAPESGSKEILKYIKKKVKLDLMLKSIRSSNKVGMNIKLNMIIGFPEEKQKHIWQTAWFLVKSSFAGAHDAYPVIFNPYPGSALFREVEQKGLVDMTNDEYFKRVIQTDTFTKVHSYNYHMSRGTIVIYTMMLFLVFYLSNYLFRPWRPFRSLYNILTNNIKSRGEITLSELIRTKKNSNMLNRSKELYDVSYYTE